MNHVRWTPHIVIALLIGAALYVAGVPILGFLPVLLFLACPLMMILMMRNMSGHAPRHPADTEAPAAAPPDAPPSRQRP